MPKDDVVAFVRERLPMPRGCILNADCGWHGTTAVGVSIRRTVSIDLSSRLPADIRPYPQAEDSLEDSAFYSKLNEQLVSECWDHIHLNCFSGTGERLPWNQCSSLFDLCDRSQCVRTFFDRDFHFAIGAKFQFVDAGKTYWTISITGLVRT